MIQHTGVRPQRGRTSQKKIDGRLYQTIQPTSSGLVCRTSNDTARAGTAAVQLPIATWLLRGPLGSGKTTFVRGMLRALGHKGPVTSPTFTLSNVYRVRRGRWRRVVHIDAYRVRRVSEEAALDLYEAVADPACLLIIEWPENLKTRRWLAAGTVRFAHLATGRRLKFS